MMGHFFFCKQKTAYEMRISDWSSDVCSSDLCAPVRPAPSGGVVDNAHRELCFPSDVLRPLRQRHRPADVRRDALLPLEIPRQGIALGRDDPTPEIGAILLVDQHPHTRTQPRLLTCFLGRAARPALDALAPLPRPAAPPQPHP